MYCAVVGTPIPRMIEPIIVSMSASGRIPYDMLMTKDENASPMPVMPMTPMMSPEQAQAAATSTAPMAPSISACRTLFGVMRYSGRPSQVAATIRTIDQKTAFTGEYPVARNPTSVTSGMM